MSMVETASKIRNYEPPAPYAFSADYVIAFAAKRLDQVEGNMNMLMKKMDASQKDATAINALKTYLNNHAKGFASDAELQAAYNEIERIAATLPEGSPARAHLLDLKNNNSSLLNRTEGDGKKDNCVTEAEVTQIQANLDILARDIDSASSKGQLYANKYLGEQSQILQMAAQMIQSFNETAKAIIGRG